MSSQTKNSEELMGRAEELGINGALLDSNPNMDTATVPEARITAETNTDTIGLDKVDDIQEVDSADILDEPGHNLKDISPDEGNRDESLFESNDHTADPELEVLIASLESCWDQEIQKNTEANTDYLSYNLRNLSRMSSLLPPTTNSNSGWAKTTFMATAIVLLAVIGGFFGGTFALQIENRFPGSIVSASNRTDLARSPERTQAQHPSSDISSQSDQKRRTASNDINTQTVPSEGIQSPRSPIASSNPSLQTPQHIGNALVAKLNRAFVSVAESETRSMTDNFEKTQPSSIHLQAYGNSINHQKAPLNMDTRLQMSTSTRSPASHKESRPDPLSPSSTRFAIETSALPVVNQESESLLPSHNSAETITANTEETAPSTDEGTDPNETLGKDASSQVSSPLPETPTRSQVIAGFESVRHQLTQCAAGKHGIAKVSATLMGSGRVAYALIDGVFRGTPEGSCMALAVRKATFPQFDQPKLTVLFPIAL